MIPTAKELFGFMLREDADVSYEEAMIQFARMHVQEALKQASEAAYLFADPRMSEYECNYEIIESYPLENIK